MAAQIVAGPERPSGVRGFTFVAQFGHDVPGQWAGRHRGRCRGCRGTWPEGTRGGKPGVNRGAALPYGDGACTVEVEWAAKQWQRTDGPILVRPS